MDSGFAFAFHRGEPRVFPFLPPHFIDDEDWKIRPSAGISPGLVAEITRQQRRFGPCAARDRELRRLAEPEARVVMTGQQTGLFLGPLYTLYKAMDAIVWARRIEERIGSAVIPIFWLQSEDHDYEEIAETTILDRGGDMRCLRAPSVGSPRSSVAHRRFDARIEDALKELRGCLLGFEGGAHECERWVHRYREGISPVEAFAFVLAELFADDGLVIFDPRTDAIAELVAPLHERALRDASSIGQSLQQRSEELSSAGFRPQVKILPDRALSFFHDERASGPRFRVIPGTGIVRLASSAKTLSFKELDRALTKEPLRFSTSALLRPVVQDTLFPTSAYVAGPGEIAYFAQLAPLYEHFECAMPMIVPRRQCVLVEPEARRVLDKLGLGASEVDTQCLEAIFARELHFDKADLRSRLLGEFEASIEALKPQFLSLDAMLERPLERARGSVERAVGRLATKVERAERRCRETARRRIRVLNNHLYPGGAPQERVFGAPRYFARFGCSQLLQAIREADATRVAGPVAIEPRVGPEGGRLA